MGKKTSIYLSADLAEKIRVPPRGPSSAVSATIERYHALLDSEKKKLHLIFTAEEWNAMRNACNGTAWTAASIRGGVLANIQDSLDVEIESFGAVRFDLEQKIALLTPVQQFALVEMIEAFWEMGQDPEQEPGE